VKTETEFFTKRLYNRNFHFTAIFQIAIEGHVACDSQHKWF